jgi:sigma-B regulation protein RsbU (phosphoserine phosphatase)
MARISQFLNQRAKGEKYATAFYCTLGRNGELHWANAGHPRPFLVRANAELLQLDSTGLPLGMLEGSAYGCESVQLAPGDKVVLYTDGLSEAENSDGAFFDRSRLLQVLRSNAASSGAELHTRLVESLEEFTDGAELADDVTVLVLEYRGSGSIAAAG